MTQHQPAEPASCTVGDCSFMTPSWHQGEESSSGDERQKEMGESSFALESREGQKHSLPEMREKGMRGALLPWAERRKIQESMSPP